MTNSNYDDNQDFVADLAYDGEYITWQGAEFQYRAEVSEDAEPVNITVFVPERSDYNEDRAGIPRAVTEFAKRVASGEIKEFDPRRIRGFKERFNEADGWSETWLLVTVSTREADTSLYNFNHLFLSPRDAGSAVAAVLDTIACWDDVLETAGILSAFNWGSELPDFVTIKPLTQAAGRELFNVLGEAAVHVV